MCACVRVYFTVMGVFTNCSVLVELKTFPIKEKSSLKAAITENGGTICFVVNKQVRGHDCPCNHRSTSIENPVCDLCPRFPTVLSDPDQRRVQPEHQQAAQHQEVPDTGGGGGLHLQLPGERRSPPRGWIPAGRFPHPCTHDKK